MFKDVRVLSILHRDSCDGPGYYQFSAIDYDAFGRTSRTIAINIMIVCAWEWHGFTPSQVLPG